MSFMSDCIKIYDAVYINGKLVGSESSHRTGKHCVVQARWADGCGNIANNGEVRPGMVKYCVKHVLDLPSGESKEHVFLVVEWYACFSGNISVKPPYSVWCRKTINDGPSKYLPIQRVKCRCAWVNSYVGNQPVVIVSPIPCSLFL